MFLNLETHEQTKIAIKDDSGYTLTYRDICNVIYKFEVLKLPRSVIFCLC